jgi:aminomuconate-semialdehyde/2-hydroxymuconate-6-semialdehyde dehydrogenase
MVERLHNWIDGRPVPPISGAYLENPEPATGRIFALVPDSDAADIARAVESARAAFPGWSRAPATLRARKLLDVADLLERNLERFARAESIDTGKPIRLARTLDIPRAIANFRFFATAILHTRSESRLTDGAALNVTLRQPRGVAGCISPWNLPLYLFSWKIAPALATGNTVVGKPSEVTPYTAYLLGEICREADLPPGVLNIVQGRGATAGAALVDHPDVPAITFTGGTATGAELGARAARRFKKVSLELGGKNPTIVFADVDLDRVVPEAVRAAFSNQGQICLSGSRIYVEESLYPRFLERFVDAVSRLRIGDPLEETTEFGALVSSAHRDKVASYIALAREEAGEILLGGGPPPSLPERCRHGYFLLPTVITGLEPQSRLMREEVFGPVVTVSPFRSASEVVALANGTEYGLAAMVWTRDLDRAHRVAAQLEAGVVWVNCWMLRDLRTPFGGMKQSGIGREGGEDALRFFTETKNVCIRLEEEDPA